MLILQESVVTLGLMMTLLTFVLALVVVFFLTQIPSGRRVADSFVDWYGIRRRRSRIYAQLKNSKRTYRWQAQIWTSIDESNSLGLDRIWI